MKTAEVKSALHVDACSRVKLSSGRWEYTARRAFFYRNGFNAEQLAQRVRDTFGARVSVTDSGEKFVAFRGSDTVAQGSHWWVRFTLADVAA